VPDAPEGEPPERVSDPGTNPLAYATAAVMRPVRGLVQLLTPEQPLELQIVGRTLFHAALVGFGAGLMGVLFFAGAELVQNLLLEQLAG
jgi:CIC family chloride channel protein